MKLKRLISCGLVGILTGVGILMNAKVSSAEDKTYDYEFTKEGAFSKNGSQKLGDIEWNLSGDGGYWGFANGQQFGSKNKPYKNLKLSTNVEINNVKEVTVYGSTAAGSNATMQFSVGELKSENYDADRDHGGNYSKEGDMFNREHSIPQSWFNKKSPMRSDLFHVYPTDGYVNNKRSNYPFGEVSNATYTSKNGSKVGHSSFDGYSGIVFEPIDEYKGDFARTYFYMATRYKSQVGTWGSGANVVFKGTYPYLTDYALNLFTKWSHEDPVSEKETNRNDAVYGIQHNRNPYIDHPEYVDIVFPNKYADTPVTPSDEYKIILDANGGTFASSVVTSYTVKNGESQTITLPTKDLVTAPNGGGNLKNFTDGTNTYEAGETVTISSKTTIKAIYDIPSSLTVKQALDICASAGEAGTSISYTVRGTVKIVTDISTQYKNTTFVITDGTNDLTIFRADLNSSYEPKVGDVVEATGPLVNYKGNTPEMTKNGSLRVSYKLAEAQPKEELKHFVADMDLALNIRYTKEEVLSLTANLIVNNNESNTKYYIIMTSLDDDEISESYNGEKTYNEFCNVIRTNLELFNLVESNKLLQITLPKTMKLNMYLIAENESGIKISKSIEISTYDLYKANYDLYSDTQKTLIDKFFE